jgi:hypothetical protein
LRELLPDQRPLAPRNRGTSLLNFADGRGYDRCAVTGMVKFQPHASAHEPGFQHRTAPGRARDRYRDRARAELRVSPQQRLVISHKHGRVAMMLRLNKEDGPWFEVSEENAAFDLRLHNITVHPIAKVGVGPKHLRLQIAVHEGSQLVDVCIIHP